ncbi:MAG TPA: HEAT repeat domain-containing protein [Gemmataceae bacterium]|nr:HEAT repeat domain-containing protein [Gemmataceae bacterium]
MNPIRRTRCLSRWLTVVVALLCGSAVLAEPPPDLHQQLQDPSPAVRAKAALTLAEANDAEAIPVLIDLLAELSAAERRPVEECLTKLAGEWAPLLHLATDDAIDRRVRRDAWASWWRRTDGAVLLAALPQHTLTPDKRRRIQELLPQLGNDDFAIRERASQKLLAFGRLVLPNLREVVKDRDLEVARRAKMLIERIEAGPDWRLPLTTLRLLAVRKPAGAVEALLAFLPFAKDEVWEEELRKSLAMLARRDGKLDPALRRALAAAQPKVRAIAAEALIEGGGPGGRAAVRKLLREDNPTVRLRAALALARTGEREGVAVLIDLLPLLSADECGQAEEALYQLTGDTAPEMSQAAGGDARNTRRDVWAAWWKRNAKQVDMTRLRTEALLGYTVICDNFGGRVFEIDRRGKERWSIGDLQIPIDAVVLPGNRVLIAEYKANRVAERDFKGRILWQKQIADPVNAQRLPNGHTFIATENGPIVEVDRTGMEIYSIPKVPGKLLAAYRGPRGDIVCMTADGQCRLLDTSGKQLKSFAAGHDPISTAGLDVTANGHILITRHTAGQVVEFDRDGKRVLEINAAIVGCASVTWNGQVLVPDYQNQRVYEVDRAGKIVWEYKGKGHFIRARRR